MGKSFHIGTFWGIPVKLHWTFFLLHMIVTFYGYQQEGANWELILVLNVFILLIFTCVTLHEYGHALTAKKYDVPTRDIILSPIGGVARLEKTPKKPMHELWIALAGPAVNLVICILILIAFSIFFNHRIGEYGGLISNFVEHLSIDQFQLEIESLPTNFVLSILDGLFWINVALVVFNLIPAFPMDGGRVLRALLELKSSRLQATKIASSLGKVIAIVFLFLAFTQAHYTLGFIGVFVFFTASQEYKMVKIDDLMEHHTVNDVMKQTFTILDSDEPIMTVQHLVDSDKEIHFLVKDKNEQLIGVLYQQFLKDAIKRGEIHEPIAKYTSSQLEPLFTHQKIKKVYFKMLHQQLPLLPVYKEKELVGVLDIHTLNQFLNINNKKKV